MLTIRASELGSCIKAQVAVHLGYDKLPVPEKMQAAYDRGNEHEEANDDALIAQFAIIERRQEEVSLSIADAVQIVGHLDGVIALNMGIDPKRVWESKSPNAWQKFHDAYKKNDWSDPLAHRYAWQISVYMVATELEAMVTCLDGDEVKSFVIEVPPFDFRSIADRALMIDGYVRVQGSLPELCTSNDWPCPVAYLHEPDFENDPDMDRYVADYQFAGRMLKEWKAKQDRAKEKVVAQLGDREQVKTPFSTVTKYEQAAAKKYDMDAIADALAVPLSDYLLEGKPSTRVKITAKGESDADDS